jgi:hypothetical protein
MVVDFYSKQKFPEIRVSNTKKWLLLSHKVKRGRPVDGIWSEVENVVCRTIKDVATNFITNNYEPFVEELNEYKLVRY